MGKGIRQRGNQYERIVVNELKEKFKVECTTSRYSSKDKDDQKVDIFIKSKFPLNIQCKCKNNHGNPIPVLQSMPNDTNYNVVFEKVVRVGEFVYMNKEDFYEIVDLLLNENLWKR